MPTCANVSFKLNSIQNPVEMYEQDIYTIPANLAGLPAISIPSGKINDLPLGIQFIGNYLNEGLVFRQFDELEYLVDHSQSGMPLTKEFRVFFVNKTVVSVFDYWDEGNYGETKPELDSFIQIAQNIESNFFTMDIAQKKNGEWIIMELGDGQVAGIPDNADIKSFYFELKDAL